jgi:hypothetical protein
MEDTERHLREITTRIAIVRNISLFALIVCIVQLIVVVVLPDSLDTTMKTWLMVVVVGIFVGLLIATFVSRGDATIMLFINAASQFMSGVIVGMSLLILGLKVKNG